MNSTKKILAVLSTIVLSLGFALPAAAETALTGTVNTAIDTTAGGYSTSGTGVDVSVGGDASGGVSGSSNLNSNAGTASSSGNSSNASAQDSASTSASGDLDVKPLVITRADLDAKTVTATSADTAAVHSDSDLSGYIAAQLQSDDNISQVATASDTVAVTYAQHAKLFGFIPVTVDATADVDASGNVTVHYPWYAFFASTNKADLEAKVQDRVNAQLGTHGSVGANASAQASEKLSADAQAKIVAAVKAAMQDELNADASANANASGSANVQ